MGIRRAATSRPCCIQGARRGIVCFGCRWAELSLAGIWKEIRRFSHCGRFVWLDLIPLSATDTLPFVDQTVSDKEHTKAAGWIVASAEWKHLHYLDLHCGGSDPKASLKYTCSKLSPASQWKPTETKKKTHCRMNEKLNKATKGVIEKGLRLCKQRG